MNKLPWFLTLLFATTSVFLWFKQTTIQSTNSEKTSTVQNSKTSTPKESPNQNPTMQTLTSKEELKLTEVLNDHTLKKYIEREIQKRVSTEAQRLTEQDVAAFKEQEKNKKMEQTRSYMDGLESFFVNSINTYAEEFDVEQDVSDELTTLVEHGFQKQRDIYTQLTNEEITGEEYKTLSGESKQEDKTAIQELLGEEGAEDFNTILREEGRKAREEMNNTD
jgi:hypothetical protein